MRSRVVSKILGGLFLFLSLQLHWGPDSSCRTACSLPVEDMGTKSNTKTSFSVSSFGKMLPDKVPCRNSEEDSWFRNFSVF